MLSMMVHSESASVTNGETNKASTSKRKSIFSS